MRGTQALSKWRHPGRAIMIHGIGDCSDGWVRCICFLIGRRDLSRCPTRRLKTLECGAVLPTVTRPVARGLRSEYNASVHSNRLRSLASRRGSMPSRAPTQEDLIRKIQAEGVTDLRLIQAFREVPRAGFVPAEVAHRAYEDQPLPIPHGQVTTQPSLVAKMIEALQLSGSEKVLEVGTGYGFQTALLANLSAFVWSIERWGDLAQTARANLTRQGIRNVAVIVGDGSEGLPEQAPFDAILVSAAFPEVPRPLQDQLAVGGRLIQPVGPGGAEEVTLFVKTDQGLAPRRIVTGAFFVRLYGKHGFEPA